MPTTIQDFYEERTYELKNLKTDEDKDQVIINNLLKMIHCLSYDVSINIIDMDFPEKNEAFDDQCRQSVMKN